MRRSDLRFPPVKSRLDRCGLCLEPVWISASSPKVDVIWCTRCAMDMAEPNQKVARITKRQAADIRRALQ